MACRLLSTNGTNKAANIGELWYTDREALWRSGPSQYWHRVQPANFRREQRRDVLKIGEIEALDEQGRYDFLCNEYFVWKYTAKNRLATTRKCLEWYVTENRLHDLLRVKEQLLSLDHRDIGGCFETAKSIRGLGYSGASGLLSILYP